MEREFIHTQDFDKYWKSIGLSDIDLRALQNILLENPHEGDVIQGTSGARKMRFAAGDHGKRGGARVIYVDIPERAKIYLLVAYPKNAKETITPAEKKAIAVLITRLKGEQYHGRHI